MVLQEIAQNAPLRHCITGFPHVSHKNTAQAITLHLSSLICECISRVVAVVWCKIDLDFQQNSGK